MDESKLDPINPANEPSDFEVEELNDEDLEDASGGANNGCTINNAAHC